MTGAPERWRQSLTPESDRLLSVLWGKSAGKAGGRPNLLLQHLFDTMAIAGLLWDDFLPALVRRRLDAVAAAGDGRRLYTWLCGLHDIGKATPAFQGKDAALARPVRAAGFPWPDPPLTAREAAGWRHARATAAVLREQLALEWRVPGGQEQLAWIWPLLAGHHGTVPAVGEVSFLRREGHKRGRLHGAGPWGVAQRALLDVVTIAAGHDTLQDAMPAARPTRTDQLALAGYIVMADWMASDENSFKGVDSFDGVGLAVADRRARVAWRALGVRPGWGVLPEPAGDLMAVRFGRPARPLQEAAIKAARVLPGPGLLVIEAPMGEGKTEAALCAAEVLASRFGADGVYVGMPTQATADPMFTRTRSWLQSIDAHAPIALVHGKRMFNDEWRRLLSATPITSETPDPPGHECEPDSYGMVDDPPPVYSGVAEDAGPHDVERVAPAEWLLGRHRALLTPNGVGTIDQVLFAGTRSRFVMLRTAGLVGKVVVLDEVHAADMYMAQFLGEVLGWLGAGSIPVVLLTATLAPEQRRDLVRSYLRGQLQDAHLEVVLDDELAGYPSVLATTCEGARASTSVEVCAPWRDDLAVTVAVAEEVADPDEVVERVLKECLAEGGCVLVLRNTVARAQATYRRLETMFGDDVVLLHSRFAAADRAERTEAVLRRLGPPPDARPHRLVVVATQVAEQSFDVDVDLIITDVAPIDLLLQRIGRLHRHQRDSESRPSALRKPTVVVTGLRRTEGAPWFAPGCEAVYGRYPLLRAVVLVEAGETSGGWHIPSQVPELVASGYSDDGALPDAWAADAGTAREEWQVAQQRRHDAAQPYLLAARGHLTAPDLEGLHTGGDASTKDIEGRVRVRDGDDGEEVVLLRRDDVGYRALDGGDLGPNADAGPQHLASVLGGTVRLPMRHGLSEAIRAAGTFPPWVGHPWLGRSHVVLLEQGAAEIGGWVLRYDQAVGLTIERGR